MEYKLVPLDLLVLVSLSLFFCSTVEGANITVQMGRSATLQCTGITNVFREWQRLDTGDTWVQLITLYTGGSTPDLQEKVGLDTFNLRGRFTATADDDFTATITNTRASDDGRYQCDGSSSGGSIVHTLLTYNMVSASIEPAGPAIGYIGRNFQFRCEALNSKPTASFNWTKQGDSNFAATGATLQFSNLNVNDSGTYQCTAYHAYDSDTATVQLMVTEEPATTPTSQGRTGVVTSAPISHASKPTGSNIGTNAPQTGGLSTGAQAGIGIGVALGCIALAGVLAYFFVVKRKRAVESGGEDFALQTQPGGHPGAPENLSRPPPNEPEVMYAELDLKNAPAGSRRPYVATPDDSPTEYAQIRPDKPPRSSVPHTLGPDNKTEYASISRQKPGRRDDLQAV
ncbi:cell wall integrity and stress response component 2-like isoform X2 [Branchiostoma floridae]|uniref:Cell wall integrity and stress response component 2-like isoform X2 n=1 Tax=Branchiostoma floridae TaxID=7739 RepID=A0A9J7MJQ5_BRAFL|nr:cell wall integrity and stress response component 2-like isoform X2 [Branchiostoma floridae]